MRKRTGLLLFVALATGGFLGGEVLLKKYRPDWHEAIRDKARILEAQYWTAKPWKEGSEYKYDAVHPWYLAYKPAEMIRIGSTEDVQVRREKLIDVVWGGAGFPASDLPGKVELGVKVPELAGMPALGAVDRYTSVRAPGLPSIMLHLHAASPNGRLVLYLQGHGGNYRNKGRPVLSALVAAGYDVIGIDMPLYSGNLKVDLPGIGPLWVSSHGDLEWLGDPIAYFMQPVAEAVNYVTQKHDYKDIFMLGFSGGGWTTTVYSAIDPRIRKSYEVAGTAPVYLRRYPRDTYERSTNWGDFEQHWPPLLKAASYLEMYVLAAHGPGRRFTQVLNKYDSCCFAGIGWTTYEPAVKARVETLGAGEFAVVPDASHGDHKLSRAALAQILDDMARD